MKNPFPKASEQVVKPFDYPIIHTFRLEKPLIPKVLNFFELVRERRSLRNLSALTGVQLHELLWYSSKVIETHCQANGYILSRRPAPSAGARHPIDILVSAPDDRLVLSYYNPFEHSLNRLKLDETLVGRLLGHINQNLEINDATLIWFVAHTDRTSAKYDDSDSLVWRDAGALIYCMQLVATALGLGSCTVGTLGEPFITELFPPNTGIRSTGGIIIGNNLAI